jgi:hypothetical protein
MVLPKDVGDNRYSLVRTKYCSFFDIKKLPYFATKKSFDFTPSRGGQAGL